MHVYPLSAYMHQIKASKLHNKPADDSLATLKHDFITNLIYCLTMAGHLRACTAIVDTVLPAAVLAELDMNFRTLHELYKDTESVLCWLAQHGLIHNSLRCDHCDIDMLLWSQAGTVNDYHWAC